MTKQDRAMISIIIPAYLQEETIVGDLKNLYAALSQIHHPYEVILVIDGTEDETKTRAQKLQTKLDQLKIFQLTKNRGKGFAIRHGMKQARGDYIAFLDAGMEIDPQGLAMLLAHFKWYEADIVVGSKRHPVSVVDYPLVRQILSWGYYQLVRLLFGVKVKDTQTGIKIFKRSVITKILPYLLVKKYAFDIEMLIAAKAHGYDRIYEAPIKLEHKFSSLTSAATWQAIYNMLYDTLAVFYRHHLRQHYTPKD